MNLVFKSLILITSIWIVLFVLIFYHNQIMPISILFDNLIFKNDYISRKKYIKLVQSGTSISNFENYILIAGLVNSIFRNHILEILLIVLIYITFFHKLGFLNSMIHKISVYFGFGIQEQTETIILNQKQFHRMSYDNNIIIAENDEEPPALETSCKYRIHNNESSTSLASNITDPPDWYVFDPVYGVIPQETRDLWNKQKTTHRVKNKKNIPPIRFSGGN